MSTRFVFKTAVFLGSLAVLFLIQLSLTPQLKDAEYQIDGATDWTALEHQSLTIRESNVTVEMNLQYEVYPIHFNDFLLRVDDCLELLEVNSLTLYKGDPQWCNFPNWKSLALSSALKPGMNRLRVRFANGQSKGGILFAVSERDPKVLVLRLLLLVLCSWYCFQIFSLLPFRPGPIFLPVLFGGVLVRVLYYLAIPYQFYSYDVNSHEDYILSIRKTLAVPDPGGGFLFHHPPLYYFIWAIWARVNGFFDRAFENAMADAVLISLLFSVGALAIAYSITSKVQSRNGSLAAALFFSIIAVTPGVVFNAARLSNDTLQCTVFMAFLLVALRWWQEHTSRRFIILSILVGVGLLVKFNAFVLLAVLWLLLLLRSDLRISTRLKYWTMSVLIIAALTGPYFYERYILHGAPGPSESIGSQADEGLRIPGNLSSLFVFNPVALLQKPFNNPFRTELRREFFFEYFFRSILFGEFVFDGPLHAVSGLVIGTALLCLLLFLLGLMHSTCNKIKEDAPFAALLVISLAALIYLRTVLPLSCHQDFRLIPAVIVPIAYYIMKGASFLNSRITNAGTFIISSYVASCTLFLVMVYLNSPYK